MWFGLSALLAGVSLALLCWLVLQPGRRIAPLSAAQGWRGRVQVCVWPWLDGVATMCRPFVGWQWRTILRQRMARAGLVEPWTPEHIVALQCWLAVGALSVVVVGGGRGLALTGATLVPAAGVALVVAVVWPWAWLGGRIRQRQQVLQRELPFFLDLITLCVEAGQSLNGALQQAVRHGAQGPLTHELTLTLAQLRTGVARSAAFDALAERTGLGALQQLAFTLQQADQFGMSLGPILRAQASQQRDERFLRAEKLALEAPVKMLFPLVFCMFPCTFLMIGFPLLAGFLVT